MINEGKQNYPPFMFALFWLYGSSNHKKTLAEILVEQHQQSVWVDLIDADFRPYQHGDKFPSELKEPRDFLISLYLSL